MSEGVSTEELLRRVQSAMEPDRELDLALQCALSGKPWRWHRRDDETITWEQYGPNALGNPICSLEHYTESIDDAVALSEGAFPGIWYLLGKSKTRGSEPPFGAQLIFFDEVIGEAEHETSLPLALCAAILKAKIAGRHQ